MTPEWPILSLFSGAGGMDLGFKMEGFVPLLALDSSHDAIATYRRNHPRARAEQRNLLQASVQEITTLWDEVSDQPPAGVIGGPPCQAFSAGNVRIKPDDERRVLPSRYAELLGELNCRYRLKFFVFENVSGIRMRRHQADYEKYRRQFEEAGFRLFEQVLDAQHFGVPQRRARLFVVGLNRELFPTQEFLFPKPADRHQPVPVWKVLSELPEPTFYQRGLTPDKIQHHPNHWTMVPRSPKFEQPAQQLNWHWRSFRPLLWNAPSWTVAYGNREVHIHPKGHRRLSVYEAMLLQGFPDSYVLEGSLSAQITQVSNAVPPPLAAALARAIKAFLA